jgi:hypothetical protein
LPSSNAPAAIARSGRAGAAADASHLRLLELIAERVDPPQAGALAARRAALEHAVTPKALADALAASRASAAQLLETCAARKFDAGDARVFLQRLLHGARNGEFPQPAVAEQVTYALGTLLAALDTESRKAGVDAALNALYDEGGKLERFDAGRWQKAATLLADKLGVT